MIQNPLPSADSQRSLDVENLKKQFADPKCEKLRKNNKGSVERALKTQARKSVFMERVRERSDVCSQESASRKRIYDLYFYQFSVMHSVVCFLKAAFIEMRYEASPNIVLYKKRLMFVEINIELLFSEIYIGKAVSCDMCFGHGSIPGAARYVRCRKCIGRGSVDMPSYYGDNPVHINAMEILSDEACAEVERLGRDCKICMTREGTHAFYTCGHAFICKICIYEMLARDLKAVCPFCRQDIAGVLRLHI